MVTLKSSRCMSGSLSLIPPGKKFQPNVMEKSILKHLTTILESSCNNEGEQGCKTYSLLYSSVRILAITRPILLPVASVLLFYINNLTSSINRMELIAVLCLKYLSDIQNAGFHMYTDCNIPNSWHSLFQQDNVSLAIHR